MTNLRGKDGVGQDTREVSGQLGRLNLGDRSTRHVRHGPEVFKITGVTVDGHHVHGYTVRRGLLTEHHSTRGS